MRYISSCLCLIFCLSTAIELQAKPRQKIGLVLSGGGAKGAAHIGVLKVLEQNNVPIDYIVGTSIGAYVGGLYALGYTPDQIETIMMNLNWDLSFSDRIPRESLRFEDQKIKDKYNIPLRFGYSNKTFKTPSGLLLGQSSTQLLRESTDVVTIFESFDQLATPYRAVATDLATAKSVVIDKGSITQAMSASAAVPGVLEPVYIDGRLLVDGGISNNMPINVIKDMGADRVITVDIGSPLLNQDQINNTIDVLNQLSTILTNNTTLNQLTYLAQTDVYIRPEIDQLSTVDFSIMPEAFALGTKAAEAQKDKLQALSISHEEFLSYQEARKFKSLRWFNERNKPISAIEINNSSLVEDYILQQAFGIKVGDIVTEKILQDAIDRVYALDRFERVDAEFVDAPNSRKLILITVPKSWGPNYINLGLNFQTDFRDTTIISLNGAYTLTDITPNSGQWKNEVTLGWEGGISTEFYQPIDFEQVFFSRTVAEFKQNRWIESGYRSELVEEYFRLYTGLGYSYDDQGLIELGVINDMGRLKFKKSDLDDIDYQSYGAMLTFGYDNLNSYYFPTSGNKFFVDVIWLKDEYESKELIHSKDESLTINMNWRGAFSIKNHTFVGMADFTTVNIDTDFSAHITELGGFLNLSGYSQDSLLGLNKVFGGIVYQYDLGRDFPGSTDLPLYVGTSLEAGNVWVDSKDMDINDLITSGSIFIGTDTSYGPAVLGYGVASDGEKTLFMSFGKIW